MNDFVFDLTSREVAIKSLAEFTGVSEVDIEMFLLKNAYDYDDLFEKFIKRFNVVIDLLDIRNLYFKLIQVTTNGDNCESIKRYGLLNAQEAIKEDTYFARYLSSKGLKIDFKEESINYNGTIYDKFNEHNRKIERCFTKLFSTYHYPINAFIYSDNPLGYGDRINRKPELIGDLANAFNKGIEREWIENTKCFLIVFKASIYDLDCSVFGNNLDDFEDNPDKIIKEWLVSKSLDVIHDLKIKDRHSDVYAYMKPKCKIEPEKILEYIEIND